MNDGYYLPSAAFHYRLSGLFLNGPSKEFVEDIWHEGFPARSEFMDNDDLKEGHRLLSELKARFRGTKEFYESFMDEFTQLFLGPVKVYPYESVYLDTVNMGGMIIEGLMMGESTQKVRDEYTAYDRRKSINLPDDHVGFELAFLGHLHHLSEETSDLRHLGMAKNFMERHLIRWVPKFCDDLYECADLYKPIAKILKGIVLYEYTALMLQTQPEQR